MMNPRGEKFVSRMLLGGCATTLFGGLLFGMVFFGGLLRMRETQGADIGQLLGAAFFLLIALAGMAMMVLGLVSGFKFSAGGDAGAMKHLPEVVVVSRFAMNEVGEMIFTDFEYDAPGGKLYVQLRYPDGHVEEMRTAWGVFSQCGEGMRGAAMVKGTWLSSFAPMITEAEPLRNPDL